MSISTVMLTSAIVKDPDTGLPSRQSAVFAIWDTAGVAITGDTTTGSNTVLNVSATANLRVGMVVTGSGIPAGTTITAIGDTQITLSANATATASAVALNAVGSYLWSNGSIPLGVDPATWISQNAASLWAEAQAGAQLMPSDVQGRAILFQVQAPGVSAAGCIAVTLKSSSLFAGFATAKKNAINAVLDSAATTQNAFMSAPGLVLS